MAEDAPSEAVQRLARLEDERYGYALLRLLRLAGWEIGITRRFGGGVILALRKPGVGEVCDHGESVATIVQGLFVAAVKLQRGADTSERVRRDGARLRVVI